jgi:hypothetical protein
MGLKAFFAMRFVAIAAISLISRYIVLPLIPTVIPLPTEIQQPLWWLVIGVATILIMASAYRQLQHEPAEPEEMVHKADEFDLTKREHLALIMPETKLSDNPGIREIETRSVESPSKLNNPTPPKTPTKTDILRAFKRRTLEEIEHGKIEVKATMERDGDGKLHVTEFTSTIETDGETPKKKPPEKFKPGPIETSRG